MQIDLFWIVLAIVLYVFLLSLFFLNRKKIGSLRDSLTDALHKKAEVGNFLSLFSKNLRSVSEIQDSMRMTAHYVADLIGAKSLCIFILDDDGEYLYAEGVAGPFPPLHSSPDRVLTKPRYLLEALRKEKIRLGEGIIGKVAQSRESIFLEDASQEESLANSPIFIDSLMAVPMIRDGVVAGVLCALNNRHSGGAFTAEQFSALRFMSNQVVLAHNLVRIYSKLSEQQRIAQELSFARQLQSSLLPDAAPKWGHFEIEAFSKPAKEVSGDFYDFVQIDEERMLVVIADACGKGIPACMLMAMTRSFIRAGIERFTNLHDMMKDLNKDLFRDTGDERFVTVTCCLLNKKESTVEFARAGHTELLISRKNHPVRTIFPDGAALGLLPSEIVGNFDLISFAFLSDMSILLFSDGITEALNRAGDEFGLDPLIKILKKNESESPTVLIENILKEVNKFASGTIQADDQTMVVINYKG
jgi:sigma-B regulation protein RsbU (phosphoserine phosphatase)